MTIKDILKSAEESCNTPSGTMYCASAANISTAIKGVIAVLTSILPDDILEVDIDDSRPKT